MLKDTLNTFSQAVLQCHEQHKLPIFTATTASNLKVYRHNWLFGLLTALQRRYPSVEKILQPDNFKFFAKEFIFVYPSRVSNIDDYGENFADFLQPRPELQTLPYVGDLARLDDVYYRHDPHYHVQVSHGSVQLWQNIQTDTTPQTLSINPAQQQRISCSTDHDGNFCLHLHEN